MVINHFGIRKGLDPIIKNHRDCIQSRFPATPPCPWRGVAVAMVSPPQDRGIAGSGNEIGLHNDIYRTKAESTNFEDVSLKYNLNVKLLKM